MNSIILLWAVNYTSTNKLVLSCNTTGLIILPLGFTMYSSHICDWFSLATYPCCHDMHFNAHLVHLLHKGLFLKIILNIKQPNYGTWWHTWGTVQCSSSPHNFLFIFCTKQNITSSSSVKNMFTSCLSIAGDKL